MKNKKTVYYKTESDDFFKTKNKLPVIDENYKYIRRGFFASLTRVLLYRIVALPIAVVYSKLILKDKYIGKEKLRPYKKQGYFIYSNHTQAIGDAFSPNTYLFPKPVYVVVKKDNLALPLIGKKTVHLGALPLPDNIKAAKNFAEAVSTRISEGAAIVIYPEAHVWPYYTKIREFSDTSFEFPIKTGAPVFVATRVYKRKTIGKKPRSEVYIDGPYFPDQNLSKREARKKLRDEAYRAMKERAADSDAEYINYLKLTDGGDDNVRTEK